MVYITCDGGDKEESCGSQQFHLNFIPPLSAEAVCVECGNRQEIGAANKTSP